MKNIFLIVSTICILFLVGCNINVNTNNNQELIINKDDNNINEDAYEGFIHNLVSMAESGDEKDGVCSFFLANSVHQETDGGYGSGMPDTYYFLSNNTYFWDAGDYYDPMNRVRAKAGTWKIESLEDGSNSLLKGKITLNEKYELYLEGNEIGQVDTPGGGTDKGLINYNITLKEVDNVINENIEFIQISQYSLDVGNADSPAYEYKFGDKVMYSNVAKIDKPITDFVKEDFHVSSENWIGKLLALMSENKNNQIKIGKYLISYDVNYPTEEAKQNATIYYDDLDLTLYKNNEFKLYFGEGYNIKGKYILTNDILKCKSENISFPNHEEGENKIAHITTEFEFEILDADNIRLAKIINPDYTYGSFIDTVNVPGNIYTYNEKETKEELNRQKLYLKDLKVDYTLKKENEIINDLSDSKKIVDYSIECDFEDNVNSIIQFGRIEIMNDDGSVKNSDYYMQYNDEIIKYSILGNFETEEFETTNDWKNAVLVIDLEDDDYKEIVIKTASFGNYGDFDVFDIDLYRIKDDELIYIGNIIGNDMYIKENKIYNYFSDIFWLEEEIITNYFEIEEDKIIPIYKFDYENNSVNGNEYTVSFPMIIEGTGFSQEDAETLQIGENIKIIELKNIETINSGAKVQRANGEIVNVIATYAGLI